MSATEHGAVDRRAEWRAGFDAGRKAGAIVYFESRTMENVALTIILLEATVDILSRELAARDRALERQRAKLIEAYDHIVQRARERAAA